MSKTGVVLVNIGSPEAPEEKAVGNYLKKFLMDKRIITLPFFLRWFLVYVIIVPRRAIESAKNYKKIWLKEENKSPLIFHSDKFVAQLQVELGSDFVVRMAMQYSSPELSKVYAELRQASCDRILIAPMYPQFSEATTGSVRAAVRKLTEKNLAATSLQNKKIDIQIIRPFYQEFAKAQAQVALESLKGKTFDHYLFSFHGLPISQIKKDSKCQIDDSCCLHERSCQRNCYRAQCFKTADLIAEQLHLSRDKYTVSFQSRLGRTKWIPPYTINVLKALPSRGIKKLAVLCPSFVVDCLETLEEIGMSGKETFLINGGTEFDLVPCPNVSTNWVRDFAELIKSV